jgi:hypothetical protein
MVTSCRTFSKGFRFVKKSSSWLAFEEVADIEFRI